MVGESIEKLVSILPRRFLFNALIPTFVFLTLNVAIVTTSFSSLARLNSWWTALGVLTQILMVLVYGAAVWFVASAVASQWRSIVRLYEGYPGRGLCRWLGLPTPGVKWHQEEQFDCRKRKPRASAYYRYPLLKYKDSLLPTRLGNVLLAGERYSLDRYGIDSIYFWPRLFPLLPQQFQNDYEEFVREYEFPLVISILAAFTALFSGAILLYTGESSALFVVVFLGGMLLALGSYMLSITSAEEVAEQQRAAFDLYRRRLLDAWPTVRDIDNEKNAFEDIQSFVLWNEPPSDRWAGEQAAHTARKEPDVLIDVRVTPQGRE